MYFGDTDKQQRNERLVYHQPIIPFMKPPVLSSEEVQNLSKLLISTNPNSIEVGFQLLINYNEVIPSVCNELVLISQLSWNNEQRLQAQSFLSTAFDDDQIVHWNHVFQVFHIYHNLFDRKDFEENWHWFEKHEEERHRYMSLILQNSEYAGEYFAIAETIAEYYKKRLDWAERYYHIPLQYNPHDLNALSTLANLYKYGYHDYQKALTYYDKMLTIDESHYDALEAKAVLLLDYTKQLDDAIDAFQLALKHHPNDEHLIIWLADAHMIKNTTTSYPFGKKMLEEVLERSPNNSFAWTIYGNRLWTIENKPKEAETAYQNGLKINPRSYNILGNIAELYDSVYHDYEQASDYYIKAFSIYMDDAFHLSNFIRMLIFSTSKLDDAKDYYVHLKSLFFGNIKQDPELSKQQWKAFQEAEKILLDTFPELKEL